MQKSAQKHCNIWGMPRAEGGLNLLKSNLREIFVCVDSEIRSKDRTKLMQHEGLTGGKKKTKPNK